MPQARMALFIFFANTGNTQPHLRCSGRPPTLIKVEIVLQGNFGQKKCSWQISHYRVS